MKLHSKIVILLSVFLALAALTVYPDVSGFPAGIQVDTISEHTSANGVAIDGVTLKDGVVTQTGASSSVGVTSSDADGGSISIASNCVTDDTDSGAGTQVLTGVIPAGATSLAVTCRVDTIIVGAGAASFSLGDGTDADLYGTTLAFAAGTTVDETDYTADPRTQAWSTSAGDLTLTANAGQFDSGTITCCSHYYHVTAPAS